MITFSHQKKIYKIALTKHLNEKRHRNSWVERGYGILDKDYKEAMRYLLESKEIEPDKRYQGDNLVLVVLKNKSHSFNFLVAYYDNTFVVISIMKHPLTAKDTPFETVKHRVFVPTNVYQIPYRATLHGKKARANTVLGILDALRKGA